MKQRTQLFLNDGNYMNLRDEYLAENLQWIVEYEATQGHDKVLMSAHNGHIEKTSATMAGYQSMGHYLSEQYKDHYFAIGTDFVKIHSRHKMGLVHERNIRLSIIML